MNPKIKKTRDELERTKAKITELQALVPQLERSITDMENTDIIKAVRSADIAPADLPAFIASIKNNGAAATVPVIPAVPPAEMYSEPDGDAVYGEDNGSNFSINTETNAEEEDEDNV